MTLQQFLRIFWARKWIVLALMLPIALIGSYTAMSQPRTYTAEASMIVEVRIDPVMNSIAPGLAAPGYMATQVDIIKSERVASRVVKMMGLERTPTAVSQWREQTNAKIPLDRYFAGLLQRGLSVDPGRGSNIINVYFTAQDPVFAQAAANAFVQAYMDVSVELRVAPARQSATFLDEQTRNMRSQLETAQAKLSKFQQERGIVVSDASYDQENAKYQTLTSTLAAAQNERVFTETATRFSGSMTDPDIMANGTIQGLKGQLVAAQTRLTELSEVVGKNHPSRIQTEAQIGEIKAQIAAEMRRVSAGTATINRSSGVKTAELQALVDAQKAKLQTLRADRDLEAVLKRDLDTAQRAYEAVSSRVSQFNLDSQYTQAAVRLLSPAVEPLEASKQKIVSGVAGSILGGLALALVAALVWELLDRRVRSPDDMLNLAGVPVLGVMRPEGSKRPVYRRLLQGGPGVGSPAHLLAAPGSRA